MPVISRFEMPQKTYELAQECSRLVCNISEEYQWASDRPPLDGLNMAYNSLVQCTEILDFYYHRWHEMKRGPRQRPEKEREILQENEGRLAYAQKSTLVMILSSFEASAKNALKLPRFINLTIPNRIYLGSIMRASCTANLISEADYALWQFAIELRNCIIHNNAVAERNMKCVLKYGLILNMTAGSMSQSTPNKTNLLTKRVIECYARWCSATIAKSNQ